MLLVACGGLAGIGVWPDYLFPLLWFAPRKPKGAWSGPHQRRVEALEVEDLMHPSGQAKVDEARRAGLWHRLGPAEAPASGD